ncbi:DUF2065 domain-containing protein [Halioxenophilus sp. WMMB6]|uniref:DUF2065 domain-containing protein n=1 Tax=Halioxenophilus sp. WMMB6 TaxID=3073815 RepID=UPI00295E9536|nr:DUF2065 domain-containing protein [Halioxenophilus sp. WMMB6]
MLHTLLQALCLVMVLEGILPFLNPRLWRSLVARAAMSADKHLRVMGLISMLIGVASLYLLNLGG